MGERLTVLTGHSRGLGAAIAARLLQPGHWVVGLSRRGNEGLATLATERGATLEQWPADLAEPLPVAQHLREWLAGHATSSNHSFVVRLKDGQAVIGAVGFGGGDRTAELGYAFGRPYWGQGYATEAVTSVIARARALGLRRLDAYSFVENPASARVLEKVGFHDLGLAVRDYPGRGGLRRVRHYRIVF